MISRVVAWSTAHALRVMLAAVAVALLGLFAWRGLARDAIPDLSNPQIVLVADWMGHTAPEVAEEVTTLLTGALKTVPGATTVRGTSMSGMAYIDIVFTRSEELGPARKDIVAKVAALHDRLPPNVRVQVGPVASSTGWVFQYVLTDPHRRQSGLTLRSFQEEVLRPALAEIPGVVEVVSIGGGLQQLEVDVAPDRLRDKGAAFSDVLSAVEDGLGSHHATSSDELEALPIPAAHAAGGVLLHVRDVARVRINDDMPTGLADLGGIQPAVGGVVVAARDADIPRLIDQVRRVIDAHRSKLPEGVALVVAYDRHDVIDRVSHTLLRALSEEVVVVVFVVLLFLLHGRSALVPLLTLPVVLLLTFVAMWLLKVPATIMSVGGIGIALGMAVDADVVALEACHRRLESLSPTASPTERRAQLMAAASSFAPAILTSLLITALSFLPVFAFSGETGRLLRPLALTKTLVIVASAIVTLTLAPALRAGLMQGRVRQEFDNPITSILVRVYRPFVHFALSRPVLTLSTALLAVLSCLPIVSKLGGEFLPRVDEGDLLFMPTTLPGVPPDQAAAQLALQDRALRAIPEVAVVFGKVGRGDSATDPAPYSMAETTIRLRPRDEWPLVPRARWYSAWAPKPLRHALALVWPETGKRTTSELVTLLDKAASLPGWIDAWTSPARARMDMMATGVRTPVGIRIVAAPARQNDLGARVREIAATLPGTRSAVFESLGGEPRLRFTPADLHDVDPKVVEKTVAFLASGGQVGDVEEAGRRMRVRIASDAHMFSSMPGPMRDGLHGPTDQLREATVRSRHGEVIPLGLLGKVDYSQEAAVVRAEQGEPVAYVYVDVSDGTDVLGYVERGRAEFERLIAKGGLNLAPGERIEWTGEYDLLAAGQRRLLWIAPFVALSMLLLLYAQFRSLTEALLVLVSVPFALVGSVWTLYLLGYSLSAPVWVGLLSVVGLAMQTGVVMVVYIDEAFHRRVREGRLQSREDIVAAHADGTVQRLRPKVMTITTMAAGLFPLLWADGPGAEIMRRVAAPMVGGLVTSAFLTLEVLPVLYTIWRTRQLARALRTGESIAAIVGPPPSWAKR